MPPWMAMKSGRAFYTDRFGGELKPAYEKWIALKPFENPDAPPHPFVPALYTPRTSRKSTTPETGAAQAEAQSNTTGTHCQYLSEQYRYSGHGAFLCGHGRKIHPTPCPVEFAHFRHRAVRLYAGADADAAGRLIPCYETSPSSAAPLLPLWPLPVARKSPLSPRSSPRTMASLSNPATRWLGWTASLRAAGVRVAETQPRSRRHGRAGGL